MPTLFIFGDSITWGAWDSEGGWIARLRKEIDQKNLAEREFYCPVYNLGIPGDTSERLLERFENELKARFDENEETIVIFAIGTNDSWFIPTTKKNRITIDDFKKNIQALIAAASKYTKKIAFVGLCLADETNSTPVWFDENIYYTNEYLRKYNEAVKDVCSANKVVFVDLIPRIEGNYKTLLHSDGVHPNNKGHETIHQAVRETIWRFIV